MAPFDRSNMALSCIISEIKRDIGLKSLFFHTPPTFDAQLEGGFRPHIAITFGTVKLL